MQFINDNERAIQRAVNASRLSRRLGNHVNRHFNTLWEYYIHDLERPVGYVKERVKVVLQFNVLGMDRYEVEKRLEIRNVNQFKHISIDPIEWVAGQLNYIDHPDSSEEMVYRMYRQGKINKSLAKWRNDPHSTCTIDFRDDNGSLILFIRYIHHERLELSKMIGLLENVMETYKLWNNDLGNAIAVDEFMLEVKRRCLSIDEYLSGSIHDLRDDVENTYSMILPNQDPNNGIPTSFCRYYIDSRINNLLHPLRVSGRIQDTIIRFRFSIPGFGIILYNGKLSLYNLPQLRNVFNHYGSPKDEFNPPNPLPYFKYEGLFGEIVERNNFQRYMEEILTNLYSENFTFFFNQGNRNLLDLNYRFNLGESNPSLSAKHLKFMLRIFKRWSDNTRDNDQLDEFVDRIERNLARVRWLLISSDQLNRLNDSEDYGEDNGRDTEGSYSSGFYSQTTANYDDQILDLKYLRLEPFWDYYTNDYADRVLGRSIGRIAERVTVRFQFVFKKFIGTEIPNGSVTRDLSLINLNQFKAILHHYSFPVNEFRFLDRSLHNESDEIDKRNYIQGQIDKLLLDWFDGFVFSFNQEGNGILYLDYFQVDKEFDLVLEHDRFPLYLKYMIKHLEIMMRVFKNWNDNTQDRDEVDRFVRSVRSQLLFARNNAQLLNDIDDDQIDIEDEKKDIEDSNEDIGNRVDDSSRLDNPQDSRDDNIESLSSSNEMMILNYPILPFNRRDFRDYYVDNYTGRLSGEVELITIKLNFILEGMNTLVCSRRLYLENSQLLRIVLRHYSLKPNESDAIRQSSYLRYKGLYTEMLRRNRFQEQIDEKLNELYGKNFLFYLKEDGNNPLLLEAIYSDPNDSDLNSMIRHLELILLVFKTWNDDSNDKFAVDRLLFLVRRDAERWLSSIDAGNNDPNPTINNSLLLPGNDSLNNNLGNHESRLNNTITSTDILSQYSNDNGNVTLLSRYNNDRDDTLSTNNEALPLIWTAPSVPFLPSIPTAMDGRLGGASSDVPDLLEITGNDISMMEDID